MRYRLGASWQAGRMAAIAAVFAGATACCSPADASYPWIEYYAGPTTSSSTPATVWTPEMWGWTSLSAVGTGAVDVLDSGLNAWRITDTLPSTPNPAYVTQLSAQAAVDAAAHGWRFATTARYVTDYGTNANLGLSAYVGDRAYHLMLDLTPSGDLQATLYDESSRTYPLTSGGSGAAAFHRFELQYEPATATVFFKYDGRVLDNQWNGVPLAHAATFQWGNSNQAGANRGVMEFQELTLHIGPFIAGDFNHDGVADGRDLLVWQSSAGAPFDKLADANNDGRVDAADLALWRQNFGRVDPLASAAGGAAAAPEPRSLATLLMAAVAITLRIGLPRRMPHPAV
ncbi:MAG: hypothetical protein IT424_07480 [Pirellulales bacterium]|nr:hypothetical protein [Pirellulales bacterium]